MVWVVIQEGIESNELYPHVFDTESDATDYRIGSGSATYATTEPVEMPESTDWNALAALIDSLDSLECVGIPAQGYCQSCGARTGNPHFDNCDKE
ncbi:hypothetical protein [Nocardia brasiliensis]|uniref:hypothetical protein n=1 Tax=Nocardia brasiliensis TaxID=37326 RepID=UPI002456687D|nr:hypothetical protein [Nocardia brasiliensis]